MKARGVLLLRTVAASHPLAVLGGRGAVETSTRESFPSPTTLRRCVNEVATHTTQALGLGARGVATIARRYTSQIPPREKSKKPQDAAEAALQLTRNIGIVAHIDAGKTTTTERMLFYAGVTRRMGDVDSGTTTTDFMKEEMDRGITIQSAAVSLEWKGHHINLIDTPGHVDFTVEVERALRVVDGVVALFDAAVGVQAQSYSVLRQSRKYGIPVVIFMNKMDKPNANFEVAVKTIVEKLDIEPLLLQIPLRDVGGSFEGVMDIIKMVSYRFTGEHGATVEAHNILDHEPEYLVNAAVKARHQLVSTLTTHDDSLSEAMIIALDKTEGDETAAELSLSETALNAAIRRCTLQQDVPRPLAPLLCGASRRDQGVQPLLDAVNLYLPSPADRATLTGFSADKDVVSLPPVTTLAHVPTVALAFKVTHAIGPKGTRAPLVLLRVYSGRITPRMHITNTTRQRNEVIDKLYILHANEQREVPYLAAGQIGAAFLSHTATGDTLLAQPNHIHLATTAKKFGSGEGGTNTTAISMSEGSEKPLQTLEGIETPVPVISFSIEAATRAQISLLNDALKELAVEDPSLRVTTNDFGQLVISGMGELHLDIIMSRLEHEYHLKCRLLRAIIEYRETITERIVANQLKGIVSEVPYIECDMEIIPRVDGEGRVGARDTVTFSVDPDFENSYLDNESSATSSSHSGRAFHRNEKRKNATEDIRMVVDAFSTAVKECSQLGVLAGVPMHGVVVVLKRFKKLGQNVQQRNLAVAARSVVLEALRSSTPNQLAMLEPMMEVEIHLTESDYIKQAISSLNERNAISVDIMEDGKSVRGVVPMRNIVRYTMDLRKAVKGNANMYTRLDHYRIIEEKETLARIMRNLGIIQS